MTRRFVISVRSSTALPALTNKRIVFHGINKSGSLSMTNVLREAYRFEGRTDQFFSNYHRCPSSLPELINMINRSRTGHAFFVGHYLYRAFPPDLPDCATVTQFRHPLSRVLSCYSWLKRRKAMLKGKDAPFPSLEEWIRNTGGWNHSQVVQFGEGFGKWAETPINKKDLSGLLDRALQNIEKHVVWYGIAEYFEESIYVLAHLCGLSSVLPWKKDDRNKERDPVSSLTPAQEDLIRSVFWADFELYEHVLRQFCHRVSGLAFGDDIAAYRLACAAQYKDRITSELVPIVPSPPTQ